MTTVKEFKKWLEQFPEDIEVEIVDYDDRTYVPFDIPNGETTHWEFVEIRKNMKKLYLGEE